MQIAELLTPMGKRQLEAISAYVSPEVKQALEQWAKDEERSVSWIVAKVVTDAIEQRQRQGVTK